MVSFFLPLCVYFITCHSQQIGTLQPSKPATSITRNLMNATYGVPGDDLSSQTSKPGIPIYTLIGITIVSLTIFCVLYCIGMWKDRCCPTPKVEKEASNHIQNNIINEEKTLSVDIMNDTINNLQDNINNINKSLSPETDPIPIDTAAIRQYHRSSSVGYIEAIYARYSVADEDEAMDIRDRGQTVESNNIGSFTNDNFVSTHIIE